MKDLLITTATYEKVKKGQTIYLLSNWCNTLEMQEYLKYNKVKTFPYHWKSKEKFNKDYYYLNDLYESNLKILATTLGEYNKTSKEIKYWRIIIGPWLRQFSDIAFDRYSQILCLKNKKNLYTNIFECNSDDLISDNFKDFYSESKKDLWNHNLIGIIWKDLGLSYKNISRKKINSKKINSSFEFIIKSLINKILFKIQENNKYIFHCTNISYQRLLKINFRLMQLPFKTYELNGYKFSDQVFLNIRDEIKKLLHKRNEFEVILAKLISTYLPRIYLEDFQSNKSQVLNMLPKNPKKIFTTHAYLNDDLFKIWVAEKRIFKKAKYYIIQHGGCIRTCNLDQEEAHFINSSDGFISWGWNLNNKSIINWLPSLQLKNKIIRNIRNGDILIVMASYPRYFYIHYSVPISDDYLDYLENIETLFKKIFVLNRQKVKIRFAKEDSGWEARKRLSKKLKDIKVDKNNSSLMETLRKSKLAFCTANSTVFLETLSCNFPTLVFIDLRFYEIRKDVYQDFIELNKVGICFFDIDSALEHLSNINNDINSWWYSNAIQLTRKEFVNKFAYTSKNYLDKWFQFIKKI